MSTATNMTTADLENVYDRLAQAIDAAGDKSELMLVKLALLSAHDRTMLECGRVLQSWARVFDRAKSLVLLRCLTETPIGQHFFAKSLAREFAVRRRVGRGVRDLRP